MPEPEYYFSSTVSLPNGVHIEAIVTVPAGAEWRDVGELSELVAMATNRLRVYVAESAAREGLPF